MGAVSSARCSAHRLTLPSVTPVVALHLPEPSAKRHNRKTETEAAPEAPPLSFSDASGIETRSTRLWCLVSVCPACLLLERFAG